MTTETIRLMRQHRSIRKFIDKPITTETLQEIILAAQAAAASSFLQCTSIIRVTDPKIRTQITHLAADQSYISNCAEYLIFCVDFHRHQRIVPDAQLGFTEQTIIGSIDAALMAQNAMLAAESLGLGAVFIGAMRNHTKEICQLLKLPKQVFALFGLCLGWPDQNPEVKPRLPYSMVVHENYYHDFEETCLKDYNQSISKYYCQRTSNRKTSNWSDELKTKLTKEARPYLLGCLQTQGLSTK